MKTWQKITIVLTTLILATGLLYLYNQSVSNPGKDSDQQSPVFPFNTSSDNQEGNFFTNSNTSTTNNEQDNNGEQEPLWQVSDKPVAGSQWVSSDGSVSLWYVQRENGHIYSHNPENRTSKRLTNTTIPRVRKAYIGPSGDNVVYRYIDKETENIKTYLAKVTETTEIGEEVTPYEITGGFLPDNLNLLTMSPDGSKIFSLQNNSDGVIGVLYSISSEKGQVIFESSIREWRSQWQTDENITLFTKPSINSTGVAYNLNIETGNTEKITDGVGLTISVSPNENYILTSEKKQEQYRSYLYQAENLQVNIMSPLTFTDKCSWGGSDNLLYCGVPDDIPSQALKNWYQGRLQFSDTLTLFNLNNREQKFLFTENNLNEGPFDIIDIKTNDNEDHLSFTNKIDRTLWLFNY